MGGARAPALGVSPTSLMAETMGGRGGGMAPAPAPAPVPALAESAEWRPMAEAGTQTAAPPARGVGPAPLGAGRAEGRRMGEGRYAEAAPEEEGEVVPGPAARGGRGACMEVSASGPTAGMEAGRGAGMMEGGGPREGSGFSEESLLAPAARETVAAPRAAATEAPAAAPAAPVASAGGEQICGREAFTVLEDRPAVKERVERCAGASEAGRPGRRGGGCC
jgi:hypothetical protein